MAIQDQSFSRRKSVKRSISPDSMFEIMVRSTPEHYSQQIVADPQGSISIYRSLAKQAAIVTEKIFRSQQAMFFLNYPTAGDLPASSIRRASMLVDVTRTKDLDKGRIAEITAMELGGPQGRTYFNAVRVEWIPFDPEPTKTVLFISQQPGYVGNLDHLADADGLLADRDGNVATDIVDFLTQGARVGEQAEIIQVAGAQGRIKDSGVPDQFIESDVGLYVEITDAFNTSNIGQIRRIVGFEDTGLEDPAGSAKFPHSITIDTGPQRTVIQSAQADDGGVFTDQTVEAGNATADDMTLLPATAAVGDAYYFGSNVRFNSIELNVSTAGSGDWALVWEYFNGATWTALSNIQDATGAFQIFGTSNVNYDLPSAAQWMSTTINSVLAFYIRARVDTVTTTTTQPLGQSSSLFIEQPLIAETADNITGTAKWAVRDWVELGFTLTRIVAPTGGADDNLRLLGAERGLAQQTGESDDVFRRRAAGLIETVSPSAINRALNRELSPFGQRGIAFDVGGGLGFFCDEDFLDYYEPGDPAGAPASAFRLLFSSAEAFGWFFVLLPFIDTTGVDFAFGFDDGPQTTLADGEVVVGAWDVCIWDGFNADAESAYRSIYNTIDTIRAGGVGFTMFRDDSLNDPVCGP